MKQLEAARAQPPKSAGGALQNVELRHLRYFVAVADAGSFTDAAERMFIAQPTLSQQLRRLEDIVGTRLLHRRREGVRLTTAGAVLLETSRAILSLVDHGVSHTRQAAGLGRQRLRVVVPPHLPDALAVETVSKLMAAASAADVDVSCPRTTSTPLSPSRAAASTAATASASTTRSTSTGTILCRRQAVCRAQLRPDKRQASRRRSFRRLAENCESRWLTASPEALPAALDAMILGEFEPDVWIPSGHTAADRGSISLDELAGLDTIHGPRRAQAGTYDAWTKVLQAVDTRFAFTDPPFQSSLPLTLASAAAADRPTAVSLASSRTNGCPFIATTRRGPPGVCGYGLRFTAGLSTAGRWRPRPIPT
jgi:DNA-binding transcriptional LysR family regulator